ncbi:MAG: T9SS type A sorting domain-containing protein [Chitinophagales bacterium]|nr:T9SS type A sorting domain-containing protein [Chitinophagales bacterium]MDW8419943.1 T9SS type A sorting domain-containing protein [Chitinophagales bacterium]
MTRAILYACLVIFSLSARVCWAQFCGGSGSSVCTVGGPYTQLGFYPNYDSLPCAQIGVLYDQKVDMQIPPSTVFQGNNATINWIRIDSIENLPCGICWRSNSANNQFNGNSAGCIRLTGTTYDKPGQYKLRIRITVNATVSGFIPITLSNQDAEQFGVKYWVRVRDLNNNCAPVDTLAAGNNKSNTGTAPAAQISGNTNICAGSSTTLTLTNASSYYAFKWSTNATTNSINVSSPGAYSVTAYANCSSATASVNVNVTNAQPTITANGPLTFCQGGSVTLDAGAGYDTYAWSSGSNSQSITVTTSGTYTVTVSKNGCTGTDSKTVTVTANNLNPSITANPSLNICPGGSTVLNAGSGYTTYNWSDGSTTQTITVNAAGTYTVTVTSGNCSGTASAVVNVGNFPVSVNITPAGPVTACVGDIVELDAGSGYDAYNWSNGENSQKVEVTATGSYIVTVMQNGCVGRDTVQVTFNPLPDPIISPFGTQTICSGQSVTLTLDQPYDTYSWTNGATSPITTVSQPGVYNVTVTKNGCVGSSGNPVTVVVNPTPNASIVILGTAGGYAVLQANPAGGTYQWLSQVTPSGPHTPTGETSQLDTVTCSPNPVYYTVIVTLNGCVDTSSAVAVSCAGSHDLSTALQFTLLPNPARDLLTIRYTLPETQDVTIELLDLNGRLLQRVFNGTQKTGAHEVPVTLRYFTPGAYLINFRSAAGSFSKPLIKE